jgi:hypothetical protein
MQRRAYAVSLPCSDHAAWKATFRCHGIAQQWHGIACVNICSLSAAWGRPAQIRLLPAITRTFTKAVNQNVTAFWDVLICSDDDDDDDDEDSNLYRIIQNDTFLLTNLKVKDSLSSIVMIRLHGVFFF